MRTPQILDRDSFDPQLAGLYRAERRRAYNPVLMLKAIVLQFLYDLSNRKLEEQLTGFMPFRWFLNLDPMELPPDYSAYCRFRERLGEEKISQIFNQIVMTARTKKLVSDRLSIVDATHVRAKVDTYKMNHKSDDDEPGSPKSKVDPDASYGYQSKKKPFFGYKAAVALDADSGLVTKVAATSGREHYSQHFIQVCDTLSPGHYRR